MKLSIERIRHGSKIDITPSNSAQKTELKCRMLVPDPFQIHMSQMLEKLDFLLSRWSATDTSQRSSPSPIQSKTGRAGTRLEGALVVSFPRKFTDITERQRRDLCCPSEGNRQGRAPGWLCLTGIVAEFKAVSRKP